MRLIYWGSFLLGFMPSVASASPVVIWGTTDMGIYATALNMDDRSWSCTGTYTLTIGGVESEETVFFPVSPHVNGVVVYARTINLLPSQWRFMGGQINCS